MEGRGARNAITAFFKLRSMSISALCYAAALPVSGSGSGS